MATLLAAESCWYFGTLFFRRMIAFQRDRGKIQNGAGLKDENIHFAIVWMNIQCTFDQVEANHAIICHKDLRRVTAIEFAIGFDNILLHLKTKYLLD